MKILQIGATFVGAQKKIEYAIHQCLSEQGFQSCVLYAIGKSDEPGIICYENKLYNIVRRLLRKLFGKNPKFALLSTLNLIGKIQKYTPDLIHIHIIHHGYLDYEYLLKYISKQKIPVVFTAHDMWFFTGGCYYYSLVGCEGFMNCCNDCPKSTNELDCNRKDTQKHLKNKIELFNKIKNVGFVSVSPWVYDEMQKSLISSYPQYMIMNAVDSIDYIPYHKKKNDKFTIIGVATNWDDRKGLRRFFELACDLGDSCNIILVGNVTNELQESAPDNIIFYGYTTSVNELYDLYASSDIHISMSYEETFGLTFVEAALSGIRSMGFNTTAIPTVIEKTKGYIISQNTVDAVSEKIKFLIDNRELCVLTYDELLEVKKYFSPKRMSLEYIKVYKEVYDSFKESEGLM